jgi:hypothetical protein
MQKEEGLPSPLGIGPYPCRMRRSMGLAIAALEAGEEEIASRARIFTPLFRFVSDSPLVVRGTEYQKESYYHENGF